MKTWICTQIYRKDNGLIKGYELIGEDGTIIKIDSEMLKRDIKNGRVVVLNLKLTSDNRLITCKKQDDCIKLYDSIRIGKPNIQSVNCKKSLSFRSNVKNLKMTLAKAKLAGCKIDGLNEHLYSISDYKNLIIVSDRKIKICNTVTITGRPDAQGTFEYTEFSDIDLRGADLSELKSMDSMFYSCKAKSIQFGKLDSSNITNMRWAFANIDMDELDLSYLNTSKVENMRGMFDSSRINKLNISNFDTAKVKDMSSMFSGSDIPAIDLSGFNTENVTDFDSMFYNCKAKTIDISNFSTKHTMIIEMFENCTADIIISNKNMGNIRNLYNKMKNMIIKFKD